MSSKLDFILAKAEKNSSQAQKVSAHKVKFY